MLNKAVMHNYIQSVMCNIRFNYNFNWLNLAVNDPDVSYSDQFRVCLRWSNIEQMSVSL